NGRVSNHVIVLLPLDRPSKGRAVTYVEINIVERARVPGNLQDVWHIEHDVIVTTESIPNRRSADRVVYRHRFEMNPADLDSFTRADDDSLLDRPRPDLLPCVGRRVHGAWRAVPETANMIAVRVRENDRSRPQATNAA